MPYAPPLTRAALRRLAEIRLGDARRLLAGRRYSGAYYLCGYAVECALKACIARQAGRYEFASLDRVRDSHTHDLAKLVKVADLQAQCQEEAAIDPQFQRYWSLVRDWSERSRYQVHAAAAAQSLYMAVADPQHGVLQWVKRFW